MSMIQLGIEKGFIEQNKEILVIYPRRIANPAVLQQTLVEAFEEGYFSSEEITHNKPIVLKKKNQIDVTEIFVKLYAISMRYGFDINLHTSHEKETVTIVFSYRGKIVDKSFDVEMLCAMEQDYILGWLETTLQKMDNEAGENEDGSKSVSEFSGKDNK